MTNRNPYEKGVDIPDFVEKNDDVDLSQFKMPDLDEDDDEFDDDYEPRRLSSKGVTIILSIVCVVLAIAAIAGWIFGISKNNSLKEIKEEYQAVETKLNKANEEVTSLTAINNQLADELEKLKDKGSSGESSSKAIGTYKVTVNGLGIRAGTSSKYDFVKKDILTDVVENECDINGTEVRLRQGAEFEVFEIKEADNMMSGKKSTWGRVIDGKEAWVCLIDEDGDAYANKK